MERKSFHLNQLIFCTLFAYLAVIWCRQQKISNKSKRFCLRNCPTVVIISVKINALPLTLLNREWINSWNVYQFFKLQCKNKWIKRWINWSSWIDLIVATCWELNQLEIVQKMKSDENQNKSKSMKDINCLLIASNPIKQSIHLFYAISSSLPSWSMNLY